MRHCPNCDGEVIVWDSDLEVEKCLDCGESWGVDEQESDDYFDVMAERKAGLDTPYP